MIKYFRLFLSKQLPQLLAVSAVLFVSSVQNEAWTQDHINPDKPSNIDDIFSQDEKSYYLINGSFTSNLPIIVISTNSQVISSSTTITASMKVINNGLGQMNSIDDPPTDYNGYIGIHIRGQSSQSFPKKAYKVETRQSDGSNNNVSLLNLPAENDWVFYAPFSDKSLLRNFIAFQLTRELGNYSTRTAFFELFIDNGYKGIYVLMETIKPDKNRVDVPIIDQATTLGNDLTGGYVVKVDKFDDGIYDFSTSVSFLDGEPYWYRWQYHRPTRSNINADQGDYIQGFIEQAEAAVAGNNYLNTSSGYRKYLDSYSFIDHFIIQELAKNVDAYRLSDYFTKQIDSKGGKLHAMPLWDFNLGFGNVDYDDCFLTSGWVYSSPFQPGAKPFFWKRLMDDPVFQNQIKTRWTELRSNILDTAHINYLIDSVVNYLGPAVDRNFDRWDILGHYIWPNFYVASTHADEIVWTKNWIAQRIAWLDNNIPGSFQENHSSYNGKVVISEINYKSGSIFDAGDWLELKNISSEIIDLSNWCIKDDNNLQTYTIAENTLLLPGEHLVFASDLAKFASAYPHVVNVFGSLGWNLGTQDAVRIYDQDSWLVSQVYYLNYSPWTSEPDGSGSTLELLDELGNQNSPYNWFSGCPGGSPGEDYSLPCKDLELAEFFKVNFVNVNPNPFKNILSFNVNPSGEYSHRVYSSDGRLMKILNSIESNFSIDLSDLAPGLYFLQSEHTNRAYSYQQKIVKIQE